MRMRLYFSKPPPNYECSVCGQMYSLQTSLQKHMKLHTGETTCTICNGVYSSIGNLNKHLLSGFHIGAYLEQQKPKNAKPARFVCPICQASYSSHYSLKYHMKSHTGETTCAICSKTFTMKASLKQHLIMVHHLAR
nr:PREDICTED: zinc finger protein 1 homolog [Bemisia tabaci]